jgi:hypothetical protein
MVLLNQPHVGGVGWISADPTAGFFAFRNSVDVADVSRLVFASAISETALSCMQIDNSLLLQLPQLRCSGNLLAWRSAATGYSD